MEEKNEMCGGTGTISRRETRTDKERKRGSREKEIREKERNGGRRRVERKSRGDRERERESKKAGRARSV